MTVFNQNGILTEQGKEYLAELYDFFSALEQSNAAMLNESILSPSGKGCIRRDGVEFFVWNDLEDCHERIAKVIKRMNIPIVNWEEYHGGYIREGNKRHYFFIASETLVKPSEICIPEAGERFTELEQIVKESIARGERPAK